MNNESEDNNRIPSSLGQEVSENSEKKSAGYFTDSYDDPMKSDLYEFKFHFLRFVITEFKYVKDNCVYFMTNNKALTRLFASPPKSFVNPTEDP